VITTAKSRLQSNSQVISDCSVDSRTAIIKVVVCEDNQDGILSLFALDEHGITTEEL
jgi:hypothetical protein